MSDILPIGYSIRLAVVRAVGDTFVHCAYIDRLGDDTISCPKPHPYPGFGAGIFVGVEKDTIVLIAHGPHEQPYIVGMVPNRDFYFDQDGIDNVPLEAPSYPSLKSGEICLQGPTGSYVHLFKDGSIAMDANIGDHTSDFELSSLANALFIRTNNVYNFTEAGRSIEGVVLRDVREEESSVDTQVLDFLSGETFSTVLETIGRSPSGDAEARTTKLIGKNTIRNPALVEKRSITYEYAHSYGVRDLISESNSMVSVKPNTISEDINYLNGNLSSRENRRTDVLDLNARNYNHLLERVEGTVVDIYGNILDINRHKVPVPDASTVSTGNDTDALAGLRRIYNYLRRSVKYHFEINSRKELGTADPSINNTEYNAKEHSRWFIDVDGEGLTKINIPASSETGNIPILNRHIVTRNTESDDGRDQGEFKAEDRVDVKTLQFGAKQTSDQNKFAGQSINNTDYLPISADLDTPAPVVTARTAFHDIMNIANSILTSGKLRDPKASGGVSVGPLTDQLNNKIIELTNDNRSFTPTQNEEANAGGRSVHANLDGSIEMSIGADTADRKSMLLDLAGGSISHYGRDRNGRSIIHQSDGDIIIQVGGKGISDPRFTDDFDTEDRPGRIEIHLNRPGNSAENQKIIIDENGITFDIAGNGVIQTTGDLSITAGGKLLLNGEKVWMYGITNTNIDGDRAVIGVGGEREVGRKGRKV